MRHNYVGDIGDYLKYALLRDLTGHTGEANARKQKLGVVWYLFEDPCNPSDGRHTAYLEPKNSDKYRPRDPELYDKLKQLIDEDDRHISAIRRRGILPPDTVFYEEPLRLSHLAKGNSEAINLRLQHRRQWLQGALDATKDCDIVFFDPDNGLEVSSTPKHSDRGPKFVFYDELLPFWERGQSLIIYQHCTRQGVKEQILCRQDEIKKHFGVLPSVFHYPDRGGRIFFKFDKFSF